MSLLASITAKILALTEAVLDQFVTFGTPVTASGIFGCDGANITVLVVDANTCGQTLAAQLANLAVLGLNIVRQILPGLMAQSAAVPGA